MSALAEYAAYTESDYFSDWCAENLRHSVDEFAGKPVIWEPWQREFFEELLSTDAGERPYWRSAALVVSRKNGKTAMLAALALYRLLEDEGKPEILLAAATDRQAGRLFDNVIDYLRQNPALDERVHRREYVGEVANIETGGKIIRLPSSGETLDGFNPSLAICDELHAWTTPTRRRVWTSLTTGGGARQRTQVVTITTAGDAVARASSILGRMIDENEAKGDCEEQPGLTVSRNHAGRKLVYNYSAPTLNPSDVDAMKLANPASWITEQFLAEQAANPDLTAPEVLQLHGCVWAESESAWLPAGEFEKRLLGDVDLSGRVVLAFDGSYNRDATALVGCTLDGHLFTVAVWERPDRAPADWKIPRDRVDKAVDKAMHDYDVVELACDPPGWHSEIDDWSERYDRVVLEYPTFERSRMAPACDRFRTGVIEGGLTHDGNPVLARHVRNAVAKETPSGTVITKAHKDSPKKIDAAVAAVVAYDRAMWHATSRALTPMAAWA